MKHRSNTEVGASPENNSSGKQPGEDIVLVQLPVSNLSAAASEQLTGGRRSAAHSEGLVCQVAMQSTCG